MFGIPARALVIRLLAIWLALGSALPVALHGQMEDDPLCDPGTRAGERVLTQATHDAAAGHCDVCHWLRGLRSFLAGDGTTTAPSAAPVEHVLPSVPAQARRGPRGIPVRAPPADSLS